VAIVPEAAGIVAEEPPGSPRIEEPAPVLPSAPPQLELVPVNGISVAPVMVPYVSALREAARRLGASFKLVSGYRSPAMQAALRVRYEHGDPSVLVPPAEHSYHLSGLAIDVESNRLPELGRVAEALGMRWGGRFNDPVHFDLGRR
jgi:uncharacterized protein YcbK (DUF882 family)